MATPITSSPVPATEDDGNGRARRQQRRTRRRKARARYSVIAGVAIAAAMLLALFVDGRPAFQPAGDFTLFAGFYVAAQAIERVLEVLSLSPLPPNHGEDPDQARADKTALFAALSLLAGVGVSLAFGLYFMNAIGVVATGTRSLDVLVTGLLLSGGTKTLHDLIARITASKETAEERLLRL